MKTDVDKCSVIHQQIRHVLNQYAQNIPLKTFESDQIVKYDIRLGHLEHKPVKRLVIHFRSNGCGHMTGGGCSMCGFWAETTQRKYTISTSDFVSQFLNLFGRLDITAYPIISLYNAGSLFNDEEMPFEALEYIIRQLSQCSTVKQIELESRLEYITREKICRLQRLLSHQALVVGTGLESSNTTIRELCINKQIDLREFERYIEWSRQLGVSSRIYVLMKPPFLTEQEAIEDVIATTQYLQTLNVTDIHYEAVTVEPYTLVFDLYKHGYYRPAWLWSIVEILQQIPGTVHAFMSPFRYIAESTDIPHNCSQCTERITYALIHDYCTSYDVSVLTNLACSCKSDWRKDVQFTSSLSIEERIMKWTAELLNH